MKAEFEENNEMPELLIMAAGIDAGDKNVLQNTNKRPHKSGSQTL